MALNSEQQNESKDFEDGQFRPFVLGDINFISNLLQEIENGREFTVRLLQNQSTSSKESFQDFSEFSANKLRQFGRQFIRQEQSVFEHFKETNGVEFFDNFRAAVEKYYQEWTGKLGAAIKKGIEPFQNLLESLKFLAEAWQSWIEKNSRLFDPFRNHLRRFEQQYRITQGVANQILPKHGWFLTPSLPFSFVYSVVEAGSQGPNQQRAIDKLFVDYFYSNNFMHLSMMAKSWESNQLFMPRMKIIRDCISILVLATARSHINASNLVIPTLIAQIDGIQGEFMKQKGLQCHLTYKPRGNINTDPKAWFMSLTSNDSLFNAANDIFLNILLQEAYPFVPLKDPFIFNRHKILHGEFLRYGRRDNTIRAFLVLDFLAWLK